MHYLQEIRPLQLVVSLTHHLMEVDRHVTAFACPHSIEMDPQPQLVASVDVEWRTEPHLVREGRGGEGRGREGRGGKWIEGRGGEGKGMRDRSVL